ncbi:MAG: hypothetical protein U0W24_21495 [Bacteroidales bacterium]
MTEFKVHQLIYTKLNPNDSPTGKKDFHSAFYPRDYLKNQDILIIENHIFIPDVSNFTAKQVVCFQKINAETCLLIYEIRNLPSETDTLGRGGIFIAHVFIFPENLWKKLPSPIKLFEYVNGYIYNSRADLLKSSMIDKPTGNIAPIVLHLDEKELKNTKISMPDGNFEIQLSLYLLDFFKKENREQRFIVFGKEEKSRELFDRMVSILPNELKVEIAWDTQFDGGRMVDSNKVFVSYTNRVPKGASGSVLVNLTNSSIQLTKVFKVDEEPAPFARWIAGCTSSIKYSFEVEEAYHLSNAILVDEIYNFDEDWDPECFANTNRKTIDKLFYKKCRKIFKAKVSKELLKLVTPKHKLLFYYDRLKYEDFTNYFLLIIETGRISESKLKNNIPHSIIIHNNVLKIIEKLWQTNTLDLNEFNQLHETEKLQLNRYILKSSVLKKNWYLRLIKSDEVLLKFYTRQYPKPRRIIRLFRKVLKMNEAELQKLGFDIFTIRKVFYFRLRYRVKRVLRIFGKK